MKVAHLSEPAEERVVFRDGLGVREWRDAGTGTGERVEWCHLDPAFAAAEIPLRERVSRLAKLQHVKFTRIYGLEAAKKGKGPILVSSHVAGTRLIEALEMAGHGLVAFDPGAALQVVRDVLGALAVLHDSRNVTHGALAPERILLTPTGRVVMVEHVLAQALDRLQVPRHQLWRDWRIATPPGPGQARFDIGTDLAQLGLVALAALLGRPIDEEEYPHRLRGLLIPAQDRLARSGVAPLAADVVSWVERLMPIESRRAFKTVREAQQAFEALVSPKAAGMGIAPARVKGILAAVAALAPQAAAAPAGSPAAVAAVAVAVTPGASPSDLADDIDIEALLRLEAELEGDPAPVAAIPSTAETLAAPSAELTPGAAPLAPALASAPAPPAPLAPAPVGLADADPPAQSEPPAVLADDAPLGALAQERLDLERQFAELVAAVAPDPPAVDPPTAASLRADAAEAPVRLVYDTPETVEPLVDARVLWSSMPVDASLDARPAVEAPTAGPETPDASSDADAGGLVFAFEPIAIRLPEDPAPAAAIDHVPAEWWREALPWRDEQPAEASVDAAADATEMAEAVAPSSTVDAAVADDDGDVVRRDAAAVVPAGEPAAPEADPTATQPPLDDLHDRFAEANGVGPVVTTPADDAAADDASVLPVTVQETAVEAVSLVLDEPRAENLLVAPVDAGVDDADAAMVHGEVLDARSDDCAAAASEGSPAAVDTPLENAAVTPIDDAAPAADAAPVVDAIAGDALVASSGHTADDVREVADVERLGVDESVDADASATADSLLLVPDGSDVAAAADGGGARDVACPAEPLAVDEDRAEDGAGAAEASDADAARDVLEGRWPDAALCGPDSESLPDLAGAERRTAAELLVADAAAGATVDAIGSLEDEAPPRRASWFVADAQPFERDDSAAEVPLATGGFRAFADLATTDVAAETVLVEGPAMRTAFVFPDVVEAPQAVSYFGLERTGVPEGDATPEHAAVADLVAAPPEQDASPIVDASVVPAGGWPSDAVAIDAVADASFEPLAELPAFEALADHAPAVVESLDHPWMNDVVEAEAPETSQVEPEGDAAAVVLSEPAEEPATSPEPAVEPDAPMPVEPAPVTTTPDVSPDVLPEIVIVDGGQDRNAWDHLPSERPVEEACAEAAVVVGDAMETESLAEEEAEADEAAAVGVSPTATAAGGSRKKRRRSRRRKGQPTPTPPVAAPVRTAVPEPVVVGALLAAAPSAPVAPVHGAEDAGRADPSAPRGRSLLDREVPTWTPSEHVEMRVRPLLPRSEPVAPEPPLMVPVSDAEQGAVAPVSRRDLVAPAAPARTHGGATPPPIEMLQIVEPEIRAVGMPDLDELQPKGREASVTSMAEAIGTTAAASRSGAVDRTLLSPPPVEERAWNWRRFIAAAVLIALFNGGAFAAWWWVQPGAYGTLVVQTAQSGVEVVLDGKAIGRTPFREAVTPGRHTLTLRHNGQKREMPVEISLGVVTTQALEWPMPEGGARGGLQVTSTPTAAKVYVDGQLRGETPLLLDDLPAGKQELTLRGDAGTVTVAATVLAGETTSLEVPIFAGWVVVDAPVEMHLLLRGAKIGSTMDGQILLSPGRHQIEAVSETLGFRRMLSVTIEPGEVKRVAVTLPPATLQVQDEPGSDVYVDGDRVGTLPGALKVPLGTHDVLVKRPDGSERRQTVTVRAGDTASM